MVGEGGDWYMGSKMLTTTCFSDMGGVKVGFALVCFSHQDCLSLDWFEQFIASQPFQCLIVGMIDGCARLRFEFIIHNHHHTLHFKLWVVPIWARSILRFTPRWSMFGLIQEIHNITTLPTSHYKYNEWLVKVEIVVWALKWSPQRGFQSPVVCGVKVGLALLHFLPQDSVSLDWLGQSTASQPLKYGWRRLRLGLILCNHHHTLAFE